MAMSEIVFPLIQPSSLLHVYANDYILLQHKVDQTISTETYSEGMPEKIKLHNIIK